MSTALESARSLLRHTLATLAYRAEKVLRDAPADFGTYVLGAGVRTPLQILGHLGDLVEWAEALAIGSGKWRAASAGEWDADAARFFQALARLDACLAGDAVLQHPEAQIFQGPIADAFTHVGQLAMLRRHVGSAIRPESYGRAEISIGRVGPDQSAQRKEFDGDASAKR